MLNHLAVIDKTLAFTNNQEERRTIKMRLQ